MERITTLSDIKRLKAIADLSAEDREKVKQLSQHRANLAQNALTAFEFNQEQDCNKYLILVQDSENSIKTLLNL